MVRLRLYETLSLLPANSLEPSYTHLLRMLVSEFTLSENPANTTNSLLRALCHSDDSIILGTWLQETEHRTIEDQVRFVYIVFRLDKTDRDRADTYSDNNRWINTLKIKQNTMN